METKKLLLISFFLIASVKFNGPDYRYKPGGDVPFYAKRVVPFTIPGTLKDPKFAYFPSITPVKRKKEALWEILNKDKLVSAPYKLEFLTEKNFEVVYRKRLSRDDVTKFIGK